MKFKNLISHAICLILMTLSVTPSFAAVVDQVSIGAGFASALEKRGVRSYEDFQIAPIVTAYFFDKKFEYLTDRLGYRQFLIEDKLRWRSSAIYISDDPLFPKRKSLQNFDRESTFEWVNRLEYYLPSYSEYGGEIDLELAKDVKEHSGIYADISVKFKLFEYRWNIITRDNSEFNIFATLGWGNENHNQYFYGPGARAGITHLSTGFWVNFPERADRYTPIVMLKYYQVLDSQNKTQAYAKGNDQGILLTMVGAYPIFESH